MAGQIAVAHQRAKHQTAARRILDLRKVEPGDVDQRTRPLDTVFHQIDKIRTPAEELRATRVDRAHRLVLRIRSLIAKWIHADAPFLSPRPDPSPAAARTAATMFG